MSVTGSVSRWIRELKSGDSQAATRLWNRYSLDLMRIARRRLNRAPSRVTDEEDLVVTAFHSFFRRARDGQFPQLASRSQLWALLKTITDRKVVNDLRRQMSQKRGAGRVSCEAAVRDKAEDDSHGPLSNAESFELSPDLEARIMELYESIDDELRRMVLLRQEGLTNVEIARRLDRSLSTVERRLRFLREKWEKELLE